MTLQDLLAIPNEGTSFFFPLDAVVQALPPNLSSVAHAFRANLDAVSKIISVPYRVAHFALLPELQREIRDRLRQATPKKPLGEGLIAALEARSDALAKLNEELTAVVLPGHHEKVVARARAALADADLGLGVNEIFLQSLVLSWGAVEVLANDTFVALLNNRPRLSLKLLQDPATKRLFERLRIDVELLDEHAFNLSSQMGLLLCSSRKLDGVLVMKAVFGTLFDGTEPLNSALASQNLFLLNCRRNVIVHRRGIVDEEYLRKTRDSLPVGSRLAPSLDDVNSAMAAVRDLGVALLPLAAAAMLVNSQ